MKRKILIAVMLFASGCSTLGDSLKLGAGAGVLTGAAATYAAQSSNGNQPSLENVAAGAGIGLGVGLIISHFVHKSVEEERKTYQSEQIEMHFGDLPPSPFIMSKPTSKKGGQ